mmetsp:Transcript_23992/g.69112  ORF Transcript_23992/g.69112 Transcript_23992/m.69112 type:complete len:91 (-) Transcript_23992:285-557(-)
MACRGGVIRVIELTDTRALLVDPEEPGDPSVGRWSFEPLPFSSYLRPSIPPSIHASHATIESIDRSIVLWCQSRCAFLFVYRDGEKGFSL